MKQFLLTCNVFVIFVYPNNPFIILNIIAVIMLVLNIAFSKVSE